MTSTISNHKLLQNLLKAPHKVLPSSSKIPLFTGNVGEVSSVLSEFEWLPTPWISLSTR